MARVPLVDAEDLPEEFRYCLSRPISILRALGNAPGALHAHHEYAEWIRWRSRLDPRLRQLVIIEVGLLTESDYEYSHHVALGHRFGVEDADVRELVAVLEGGGNDYFTPAELAAFRLTRELVEEREVRDPAWRDAESLLGTELVTEVAAIAGFYLYVATMIRVLRVEVEPEYRALLPRPARPAEDDRSGR
ncbi:carboxymuconolactone decarboxylase family protein [Gulosibacter sp. 10]|uniref:carboxymuconolactone decarboxylase family protein n=1 Tax=Gulosibacter sp. 10 TaxID=1255570 RepID=UPI00097EBBB2|nr:carboxymuconolactone decarboxylase family protein [Gulosibacter sp. 10]SJM51185.1 Putative uncharacterized protein BCG_1583 [Gulosibacter sp. 10]